MLPAMVGEQFHDDRSLRKARAAGQRIDVRIPRPRLKHRVLIFLVSDFLSSVSLKPSERLLTNNRLLFLTLRPLRDKPLLAG